MVVFAFRHQPLLPAAFALAALVLPWTGCEECVPGETACEGDAIMVCVDDDSYEDDDTWEEADESCDFLRYIIEIFDEATDNYWKEWKVCDEPGMTCLERTDSSGSLHANCGYSQDPWSSLPPGTPTGV